MNTFSISDDELFHRAREIGEGEARKALLRRACGDDRERQARLEKLLRSSAEAEAFFARAEPSIRGHTEKELTRVLPFLVPEIESGKAPLVTRIGRYRLLEKIGEGGCGIVYTAEQQEPVRRRVALKIIKLGMETRSVIARFEAERQALAMMDHPHIARVYDAGATERGSPYFVMELVEGEKITDYCRTRRLGLPERLKLFISICHAIQHAHQKGVVHGDVKPSNILVTTQDGEPAAKVIDFGISKATELHWGDRALFTAYTQLVGTPTYMSPEQAQMGGTDIDTRSDIYSLGVLLYELLTGCTPFSAETLLAPGLDEMRRILREKEPPTPSARLRALPAAERSRVTEDRCTHFESLYSALRGDLDWIVIKALEKDRRRRYETAYGLAMDVQRHLDHEPVLARPPSLAYRCQKNYRRNRLAFVASAAVLTSLIAGTATSTWLLLKERQMRQRAVAAEQQQSRLRHEAENRERMTQAALLVSQERYESADQLLAQSTLDRPSVEGTAVLRALGEWHATHGRWKEAGQRFMQLVRFDAIDGIDVATLDLLRLSPALHETQQGDAYEAFCLNTLSRYKGTASPFSDRVVKACLLRSPTPEVSRLLVPFVEGIRTTIPRDELAGDTFRASWQSLSLSLWEYRTGRPDQAAEWARRCLSYPGLNAPREATAHALLALALRAGGASAEADQQVAVAQGILGGMPQALGERGSPIHGFWFDRVFAEILLHEASQSEPRKLF